MDIETSEVIDRIGARIDALDASLRAEFRAEFSSVREEFREGLAQNRRHTEVLFESLRDDIRILADGFAAISTKLDSLQR
jgi:hypothetical protein